MFDASVCLLLVRLEVDPVISVPNADGLKVAKRARVLKGLVQEVVVNRGLLTTGVDKNQGFEEARVKFVHAESKQGRYSRDGELECPIRGEDAGDDFFQ